MILTVASAYLRGIFHLSLKSECFIKVYSSRMHSLHFVPVILPEVVINIYYEPLEHVNKHNIRLLFHHLSCKIHITKIPKDS